MERRLFDSLARLIVAKQSRRRAIVTLLGAGLLGHVPVTEAASNRKQRKRRRRRRHAAVTPGDQPDCTGVLTRAGCKMVNTPPEIHWECPFKANLLKANLSGCRLTHAKLPGINLGGAFLNRAIFNDADMSEANLTEATMDSTSAVNTVFIKATLHRASAADSDLRGANFSGADLLLRDWSRATCPDGFQVNTSKDGRTCCKSLNGAIPASCGKR